MLNLVWLIVTIAISAALLRWRSPMLMVVPNLLIASLVAPFAAGDAGDINLVMLSWVYIVIMVAIYMRSQKICIDGFEEDRANHARMTPRRLLLLVIGVTILCSILLAWLSQAGVDQFDSSKRTRESGQWFNLANALINVFVLHGTIVLSLFKLRLNNPHVLIALMSGALVFIVGYLSSSRGLFVEPMMTIFFMRFVRLRSAISRSNFLAAFSVFVSLALVLMAIISAERAQTDGGIGSGFQILAKQVSSSEDGYGLAPNKDSIIWDYSARNQIPAIRVVLLGGFYGLVPRALWSNKPTLVSTGPIAGAFVFRGLTYNDNQAGIPISMPSEIALAFGSAWFLPSFIAVGLLMALVSKLLRPYPILVFASFTFYAGLMSHGLPKSQVGLMLDAITLLILARVAGFKFVRTKHRLARSASPNQKDAYI